MICYEFSDFGERELIGFYIQQKAGTLILMHQEDQIGLAKEEEFVLRNGSYYDLQTKIKYKAEKAGIELIIGWVKKNNEGACKPAG